MNLSLKEKIYGCLTGAAIGDALGLGTEFMTRVEAKIRYPQGLRRYEDILRDAHRRQWKRGDWTNDTEWILLATRSMTEKKSVDNMDIAKRIKEWFDCDPPDVRTSMQWTISQDDYLDDPINVCVRTWEKMARFEASNEALGRCLTLALWPSSREEAVAKAAESCALTHADKRCIGTSAILAAMAHSLMWDDKCLEHDDIAAIGKQYYLYILPFLRTAWEGELSELELDDEETLWYTRKAAAAALWGIWHLDSPEKILYRMIDEAGDADTNASLAMALAGLKWGYSALPKHLVDGLLQKDRLFEHAEKLTAAIEEELEKRSR